MATYSTSCVSDNPSSLPISRSFTNPAPFSLPNTFLSSLYCPAPIKAYKLLNISWKKLPATASFFDHFQFKEIQNILLWEYLNMQYQNKQNKKHFILASCYFFFIKTWMWIRFLKNIKRKSSFCKRLQLELNKKCPHADFTMGLKLVTLVVVIDQQKAAWFEHTSYCVPVWLSGRALRQQRKRLWVRFPGNTHTNGKCITWMQL